MRMPGVAVWLVCAVGLACPAVSAAAPAPPPTGSELTFVCLQLRQASIAPPPVYGDRVVALRLLLDGGLQPAVATLRAGVRQGAPPPGGAQILHALRVWSEQIRSVLRAVAAGVDPRTALAAPALAQSVATLSPLLPEADGMPCALSPRESYVSPTGPLRAALLYEGVMVALGAGASPARLPMRGSWASRLTTTFVRELARLGAHFPRLAASGRALVPDLRAATSAATRGDRMTLARSLRRLVGIQPFLLGALSTRDVTAGPAPSEPPLPGAPSLVLPQVRTLGAAGAFAAMCRLGLKPVPHAVVVGEAVRGRAAPMRVLGTDPPAGSRVSPGATVVLRLGVLQGSSVVFAGACD